MKRIIFHTLAAVAIACAVPTCLKAENVRILWQIGEYGGDNAGFALAPGNFAQFKDDPLFVVGASDTRQDWPYVHPGPADSWAGGRQHAFTILFGVKQPLKEGTCRLLFDLLDTQRPSPPRLRIEVNGRAFEQQMPAGAGDASVKGAPDKGTRHSFAVEFPATLLKAGNNQVAITSLAGSWMLYDRVAMETPSDAELSPVTGAAWISSVNVVQALIERDGRFFQPVTAALAYYGPPREASVRLDGTPVGSVQLQNGKHRIEALAPAAGRETRASLTVVAEDKPLASTNVTLKPVRKMTIYVLPHSHTDIGYTEIQTAIEKRQVQNLVDGIAGAKRTADYPPGARFVWNVEVLWAADLYLNRLDEAQRADFMAAVKSGQVVLNGMYLNELTGLCRPEELLNLFRFSTILAEKTGVTIDSVMISDVPGYTWGSVTAMTQAGIKYFSTAPNYFDRIGTILKEWENKPFWWAGPDGKSKVLVWIPFKGYAMSHGYRQMTPGMVDDFCGALEKAKYPYDIAYMRWSGHGDNAVPEPEICDFVKDWNAKYAWPRFIISGTGEAFRAFEQRYGSKLPVVRGDWTPYWEDGAGSSARETALNRASSDRLSQAETLCAMLNPAAFPAGKFQEAWNSVLLYSEHTWGAWCSVSDPENQMTVEQWDIKRGYADQADRQSRDLLQASLQLAGAPAGVPGSVDVFNSLSWTRTELVTVPAAESRAGDRVSDSYGRPVPSQRLATGELVFLAKDVPPFSVRRYAISAGAALVESRAMARGDTLVNDLVRAVVDRKTGGIIEFTASGVGGNFADASNGESLNDYRYFVGNDPSKAERNGPVKITVGEPGPLVASLRIESAAPGCKRLVRELRIVASCDYIEVLNLVDKAKLAAPSYKKPNGKESLNFAFPFNVPEGKILLDLPLGAMRPEADQMPSACKNWFTVGRWADVSNARYGITLVTLDAPLVQVGGLTANLLESQTNPEVWRKKVDRTQKLYSWAMNNHWGTNYRATQEGAVLFRYVLRPHRRATTPAEATRFATGFSQPLLARPAGASPASGKPCLEVKSDGVLVTALKPSDDGKALIVRLLGASGRAETARLEWAKAPAKIWLSDTSEKPLKPASPNVPVPGWGVVTLRVEQ